MKRAGQRGVAVLSATVALLVAMTLSLVYVNRSLMFEQRSMSNQFRAVRAFEAAQAGLDWSSAMMNDDRSIDDRCAPLAAGATGGSFRDRFLKPDASGDLAPDTSAMPGCRLGAGTLQCTCTAVGLTGSGASDDVVFNLRFEPVAGDARSVLVTSRGCTDASNTCDASGATGPMQAVGKVVGSFTLRTAIPSTTLSSGSAGVPAPTITPASAAGVMVLIPGSWHDY